MAVKKKEENQRCNDLAVCSAVRQRIKATTGAAKNSSQKKEERRLTVKSGTSMVVGGRKTTRS